jgi:hypothetical protein
MKPFGLIIKLLPIIFLGGCINTTNKNVIEKNEIIIEQNTDSYMQVRHIVLRGSNEEIGKAIGAIAQEWLNIKPIVYKDTFYATAKKAYLEKNYPILAERIKGIAQSYNITLSDQTYLEGLLLYDLWPAKACSVVYYPPTTTSNGHALVGYNFDYYPLTFSELSGRIPQPHERKLCSRNFVMELYPNKGYASIGIGSMDLLNGLMSGINSAGLQVAMLSDYNCPRVLDRAAIQNSCGLIAFHFVRLLLDTCATVDEAKIAMLNNKMIYSFQPVHYQVSDKTGKSFICEIDPQTHAYHFIDNNNAPQIMTNHPCYLFPSTDQFPQTDENYFTFNRYKILENSIKQHNGFFSVDDIKNSISKTYAHGNELKINQKERIEIRTFWTAVYDITDGSMEVKFYLKDGPIDPKTGKPELFFSQPFAFQLKK